MGEVLNMFIAITAALSTVVPAEIARLILAAAVGYTIANRMSGSADDDDENEDEGKEDIEEENDDVKNSIPSMIAFSTDDDESRPALTKSSTLSSMDMSDRLSTSGEPPGKLIRQRSLLIMNEDEEEEEDEMLHILETVLTKRKQRRLSLSEEVGQDEVMSMDDKQRPQLRRPRLTKSQSEYNSSEWKEQTPRPKLLRPQLTKSQSEYNSSEWKEQTRPKARPRLMKAQSEYNSSKWQDQGRESKETQDDIRLTTRRSSLARMPSISFHLGRNRRRSA